MNNNSAMMILHCSGPDDVLLPRILSFLAWDELIVRISLVNHSWKRAVAYTPVCSFPISRDSTSKMLVDQVQLRSLIERLPRLQKIIGHWENGDGCLPENSLRLIVHGFKELRSLDISGEEPSRTTTIYHPQQQHEPELLSLESTYEPALIESICSTWNDSLLELDISHNSKVQLDLKLLAKLAKLEIVNASGCGRIHGRLSDLQILYELQVCDLQNCPLVEGHVRDLATCPKLLYLGLRGTSVHGRLVLSFDGLQPGDFESLIYIDWIHGGSMMEQQEAQQSIGADDIPGNISGIFLGKELALVSSAPMAVQRVFDLAQILPSLRLDLCSFHLSKGSPDYYSKPNRLNGLYTREPPFQVELFHIQGRRGWRWTNGTKKGVCEIQWLDSLTAFATKKQYVYYQLEVQLFTGTDDSIYQGFSVPPTEEEHNDLMYKKLIQKRRRARRLQREEGG
ncbi:unnamed protein product [Cylindrotheca closterium]|uniref:F-box domain-containing protein n=1 Tax=Cylindrotheca closterium TaxID=2856 RepID=A0AAD2FMX9_9STRA|nr:unnamed protein product [Cylindrotheca closterium]